MRNILLFILFSGVVSWTPNSWIHKEIHQIPEYKQKNLMKVQNTIRKLPPLIYAGECRNLQKELKEAGEGKRFILTAGDCAESFQDFSVDYIMNQYRIILQMTLILMYGINKPIVKIGRMAGQFAKPRSSLWETKNNQTFPIYQGDIINHIDFTLESRKPNPYLMVKAYHQSCQTLNLLRALSNGGYANVKRIFDWNLEFVKRSEVNSKYQKLSQNVQECLLFLDSVNMGKIDILNQAVFYTGHEALLLPYEESLTRIDSTSNQYYDCSGHFLWIGERTRQWNGSHVEFMRGIHNPIGIKISANYDPEEIIKIISILNPRNELGRISIITRMGTEVDKSLPPLIDLVQKNKMNVVWICDPMHANTKKTINGIKTRFLFDVKKEFECTMRIHQKMNTILAGVHLELTGEDVTECVGSDILTYNKKSFHLEKNYKSLCDPRLNAAQSLEFSFWMSDLYKRNQVL